MMTLDDITLKRLCGAVVITALRDTKAGNVEAEQWLLQSDQCQLILGLFDLDQLSIQPVIENVKNGLPLNLRGIARMRKQSSYAILTKND